MRPSVTRPSDHYNGYWIDLMTSEDGPAFWALMGPIFASREVERELGAGIYDSPEHQWLVATTEDGRLAGFAGLHTGELDKGIIWLDWAYVVPEHRGKGLYTRLFALRLQLATELGPRLIRGATAGEAPARLFTRAGFTLYRQRGRWGYYEKALLVEVQA